MNWNEKDDRDCMLYLWKLVREKSFSIQKWNVRKYSPVKVDIRVNELNLFIELKWY